MENLLSDFTILDFSHRLPGPLGMNVLGHLGAKVIKIEDKTFGDSFTTGLFSQIDQSFSDWYEHLNDKKQILKIDFKNKDSIHQIHELVKSADGCLMALPPKVRTNLQLTDEEIKKINPELAMIEMGSSTKHQISMHDLNAMALTGMLSLYVADKNEDILNPPFLPVSGILFGQQLGTQLLAAILKAKKTKQFVQTTAYLFDSAQMLCSPFWSKKLQSEKMVKFLHNGAYPCYCMYKTKDSHYVGVAAVEEKFWLDFSRIFNIPLAADKRFDTKRSSFEIVANEIKQKTLKEIETIIGTSDICVSLIEKIN